MSQKNLNARMISKHDTQASWENVSDFIPYKGEIIVYDRDDNYSYERFKIGDGITTINELPFAAIQPDWSQNDENAADYVKNRTHYVESVDETVVLPETTITPDEDGVYNITEPLSSPVVAGVTYTVMYNGIAYECLAKEKILEGMIMLYIGNSGNLPGGEDTGEPFIFAPTPAEMEANGIYASLMPLDGAESVTIKISAVNEVVKTLDPKYLANDKDKHQYLTTDENGNAKWEQMLTWKEDSVVEVLSETEFTFDESGEGAIAEPVARHPEVGNTCIVAFNGVEYETVATELEEDGLTAILLGNLSLMNQGPDTGEPFIIMIPSEELIPILNGMTYMVGILDKGSITSATVSIKENAKVYRKISSELLPTPNWEAQKGEEGYIENRTHWIEKNAVIIPETHFNDTQGTFETPIPSLIEGQEYTVLFNGTEYKQKAQPIALGGNISVLVLGNIAALMETGDTGEPFAFIEMPEEMKGEGQPYAQIQVLNHLYPEITDITVSITADSIVHKLDNKYIHTPNWNASNGEDGYIENRTHYINQTDVEIMPETTFTDISGENIVNATTSNFTAGANCVVTWNGVDYECVIQSGANSVNEDMLVAYVGNGTMLGGIETDDPFLFAKLTPAGAAQVGGGYVLYAMDGSTAVTMKIVEPAGAVHQLDKKFIPSDLMDGYVPVLRTINGKYLKEDISLKASDVGAVPTTITVNGKTLSSDITLSASDVNADPAGTAQAKIDSLNIQNGARTPHSLRTTGAAVESEEYYLGACAFAEGNRTIASGGNSHAEGQGTIASGSNSHTEGQGTIANGNSSHAEGRYNIEDTENKYAHIVGNGSFGRRSNAHTLDWDGNAWYQGNVYVGGTSQDDANILATETYVDEKVASITDSVSSVNGKTGEVVLSAVDVNAVPTTRKVNGKVLSSDITLSASDIGALPSTTVIPSIEGLATESYVNEKVAGVEIPSIEGLATETYVNEKASTKVDKTITINGKALSSSIALSANDVNADPSGSADTALANAKSYTDTKISDLINSAPTTLDTLGEIATAMAENEDVVAALEESIGTKANVSDLTSHTNDKSNPHNVTLAQLGVIATAAELNYVNDVTSNVQTQLNAKVPTTRTINGKALSSNVTLSASDIGAVSTATKVGLSGGVTGTATTFGNSTNVTIPVTDIKESYMSWGGKNLLGKLSPFDGLAINAVTNCFAFLPMEGVTVEYTRDNGATWNAMTAYDSLFLPALSNTLTIQDKPYTVNDKIRVTIDNSICHQTSYLEKLLFELYLFGVKVQIIIDSFYNNNKQSTKTIALSSGWNSIVSSSSFVVPSKYQFTFEITEVDEEKTDPSFLIKHIVGIGRPIAGSNMAKTGKLYAYDRNQNAIFPAQLSATQFTENGKSLASKYVAQTRTINGKALSSDVTLSASDVGALPSTTVIPSVEGLATETYVDEKVADIEIPSIEGLATEIYVNEKVAGTMSSTNPIGIGSFSMNRREGTAIGDCSHAEGNNTTASGDSSHAEGYYTTASRTSSHAEGSNTTASGSCSHAEGMNTTASGNYSHAEGYNVTASGSYSHAEGRNTSASEDCSHTEGMDTTASGECSHAEGKGTTASGSCSHAEGSGAKSNVILTGEANSTTYTCSDTSLCKVGGVIILGTVFAVITNVTDTTITLSRTLSTEALSETNAQLALGIAFGSRSHAEGHFATASGSYSHAEGCYTTASEECSHAEGYDTTASGDYSHAEGYYTTASGNSSHAEGNHTIASGFRSHAEGCYTTASEDNSHTEGYYTTASGNSSHAEGYFTAASGDYSHAEGIDTMASGEASHAEGRLAFAIGEYAHAEGGQDGTYTITLTGEASSIEYICDSEYALVGRRVLNSSNGTEARIIAVNTNSDGQKTITLDKTLSNEALVNYDARIYLGAAYGKFSHAEGNESLASGDHSHAEGSSTIASGYRSHAEGYHTIASGSRSHAEGDHTVASSADQHVQGKYNIVDTDDKYAHIVGNGKSDTKRSNAHTIDWDGNAWYQGHIEGTKLILPSPNGTRWAITVGDDGTLNVAAADTQ